MVPVFKVFVLRSRIISNLVFVFDSRIISIVAGLNS